MNASNKNQSSPTNIVAAAPEVPSSTFYDPRNFQTTTANNSSASQLYMNPSTMTASSMNSVATAAAAAAAAVNNSLPPLSHLLPTNNAGTHNKSSQYPSGRTSVDNAPDYFSPQAPEQTIDNNTNIRSSSVGNMSYSYPAPTNQNVPPQSQYRKSMTVYPTTTAPMDNASNRRYVTGANDAYYMLPQQPSLPQFNSNAPVVPSSTEMPIYPVAPHPYARGHLQSNYHLPSPPTSVIDSVMMSNHNQMMHGGINSNSHKVFSFVPLPGLNQKKRPRRKFHEVERLYQCNFQDCTKSYGTLNHLNAHVSMQRHGPKRQPTEFRELRKMWRKQKRDNKQRSRSRSAISMEDEEGDHLQATENAALIHTTHSQSFPPNYMPPYMLMSHPPPPPPPTLWRPNYQQAPPTEFMPPPPPGF